MKKKWNMRKIIIIISSIALAVIVISSTVVFAIGSIPIIGGRGTLSIGEQMVAVAAENMPTMPLDDELVNGLWYEDVNNPIYIDETQGQTIINTYRVSFMKIYSLGGSSRVMELSTYPRAYVDTDPHVYEEDIAFTVTQDDLNDYYYSEVAQAGIYEVRGDIEDGVPIHVDSKRNVYLLWETAYHWIGDPLPGVFPKWIESESLPLPPWSEQQKDIFPYVFNAVKGELVDVILHEAVYKEDVDATWTEMPQEIFDEFKSIFNDSSSEIKVNKLVHNKDRIIIRVYYDRIF